MNFLKKGKRKMEEKNETGIISATGWFSGNSTKSNYDLELKMKFTGDELMNAIQFVAGIGKRLKLVAVIENEKVKLGLWSVYRLSVDKNLEATVVFKTAKENAFYENIPQLLVEEEMISIKAKILDEE